MDLAEFEKRRPAFNGHELARDLYGFDRAYLMHWKDARRLVQLSFHLVLTTSWADDLILLGPAGDRALRRAVARQRKYHPDVLVHAWGLWPGRVELLVDGPAPKRNRVVGQIKSALSRCYAAMGERDYIIWWDTWGIPLERAADRLRCLNHLRRRMLELGPIRE